MSQLIEVKVPDIGDFTDVPVIELFVKVGDTIKVDDAIAMLESDKASMEVPSDVAGKIVDVKVKVGDTLKEGDEIITIGGIYGKITAISGATGAKYSLVPTDNSAGNFVKIQQRIPVRIDFINLSEEDNDRLAAGMMVVVKAKL